MIKQFYLEQFDLESVSKVDGSKYCYVWITIQLNISHLLTHS